MKASRALSKKRHEEDALRQSMSRYSRHGSRIGTAASVRTPPTPSHPYENGNVSLSGTGVIMSRDFVNTPQPDVDPGYDYIRTVSRLGKEMGEDGLGLNKTSHEDTSEKAEEFERQELWRQGSRQRKMSVFMDGTIEKREITVSTLPPSDRKDAGALPPHLTQAVVKSSKKKEEKLTEEEVVALVKGEPTKEEHEEAEGAESTADVHDLAAGHNDVDDTGGTMEVERVLGASVLVKRINGLTRRLWLKNASKYPAKKLLFR